MNRIETEFRRRFTSMFGSHVSTTKIATWANILVSLYSADRYYHNMQHPLNMLHLLDEFKEHQQGMSTQIRCDSTIEFDIFLHDAVCVPGALHGLNERQSADLLSVIFHDLGLGTPGSEFTQLHRHIIIDGTTHVRPVDGVWSNPGQLIHDLDLASLGAEPEIFQAQTEAVYFEYMPLGVSMEKFNEGRRKFFQPYLDREHIFGIPYFRDRFEDQARINLTEMCK